MGGCYTVEVIIPTRRLERQLAREGFSAIVGLDEAGRGALAGPVVAAAVLLSPTVRITGLRDSKLLSPSAREQLCKTIAQRAEAFSVGVVEAATIDAIGIDRANHLAMTRALDALPAAPDFLLADWLTVSWRGVPARGIIRGDQKVASIAAASIVAKVYRDRLLAELNIQFPGWGFAQHKGYATGDHLEKIALRGPSPVHRRSFAPVMRMEK